MLELLGFLYALGMVIFLFGGLLSGKESKDESTAHFIALTVGVAVFWLPGLLLLVLFFIWWGIVGD